MQNFEPRGNVLPIYFIADESGSMAPDVGQLTDGLASLLDQIRREPFAAASVRFSIIGFNENAHLYLDIADLRDIREMPTLKAEGRTYFSAALDMLAQIIPENVATLKAEGYRVNRPTVFLLTDGYPMEDDEWREALADLMALPARPNILAFGIGDADPQIISGLATQPGYAFIAAQGADTGRMLTEFMGSLTQSVISSGTAIGSGRGMIQPEIPEGFVTISADEV